MNQEELYHKLLYDITLIKLPSNEVEISLRPFSKTYYGRYFPTKTKDKKPRIFIYPFENEEEVYLPYDKILDTLIHEMVHHIQYCDESFKRKRGIMHDTQFWKLYNHYLDRAEKLNLLDKEVLYEYKAVVG